MYSANAKSQSFSSPARLNVNIPRFQKGAGQPEKRVSAAHFYHETILGMHFCASRG